MRKRRKLGPRIDLPPFEPWPKVPPPRNPSEIVVEMQRSRDWRRNVRSGQMVPPEVRAASEERWRTEHEALLAQEDRQRLRLEIESATYELWLLRPWCRRLIDCVFGTAPPPRPIAQRIRSPFADITVFRHAPQRPDVGLVLAGDRWCSSFDCKMPSPDEVP